MDEVCRAIKVSLGYEGDELSDNVPGQYSEGFNDVLLLAVGIGDRRAIILEIELHADHEGGHRFTTNPPAEHKTGFASFFGGLTADLHQIVEANCYRIRHRSDAKHSFCVVSASAFAHYGYLAILSRIGVLPHSGHSPETEDSGGRPQSSA
jgi:hypothetical protein